MKPDESPLLPKQPPPPSRSGSGRLMYLAAFSSSLYVVLFGMVVGYAGPATVDMARPGSRFWSQITAQDVAWIASAPSLSGIAGNILAVSENNLKYLIRFFKKRAQEGQYMDKSDFLFMLHEVLGYREHFFMNRVFMQADMKLDGKIDMEEFVRFMSLVLKGTSEEKIDFCFNCYDLNETKQLTRDVIVTLLSHTGSEASDRNADTVLDILDLLLRKLDQDADGILLHDEFKKAAMEDWLFTEAFGQCLPDYTKHMSFLENMEKNITIE